jgi:phosphonate transport system substrate-binding protein
MQPVARSNGRNGWRSFFTILVTVALLLPPPPVAAADPAVTAANPEPPLTMGIFPRRSAALSREMFTPLVSYLSRSLGRQVQLEVTQDFLSFWDQVKAGRYDIVHYNQYHYLSSHRDYGYRVIASIEEYGRANISAAVVVRKDSGINSIADLRGRKIIFGGGKQAMVSYIMARYLLMEAGLGDGDYITQFALNPPKACVAVFYRQGAAAGVGDVVLEMAGIRKQINVDEMKVLARSAPIAGLPWAVKDTVSASLATRIQTALIALSDDPDGKQILARAQLTGFKVASDADYDEHRRIIERVAGEKF